MFLSPRSLRPCPGAARLPIQAALILALLWTALGPADAPAGIRFDFEQKYYVHPGRQVWDFCLVRPDSVYHLFYHSIPVVGAHASKADTIWHATSSDLARWTLEGPVLTAGPQWYDAGAVWAPEVVRDEEAGRWIMSYTANTTQFVQRIATAHSSDLFTWVKDEQVPLLEPDPSQYLWEEDGSWEDFRDPFLYRDQDQWHVLVSARQWIGGSTGVLFHASSPDLASWSDLGPIFINDGVEPGGILESAQYRVIGNWHHLFMGEFDTMGITLLSAADPGDWTMATRRMIDFGYAPEVKEFDPGNWIFARIAPYPLPGTADYGYTVRLDTLLTQPDGSLPSVSRPHPLTAGWAQMDGTAITGNPTFGDNPLYRGEPASGLVGNGYFSSREFYQGPLSGRGVPGAEVGETATGVLRSRPFIVTGPRIDFLIGGGEFPQTCYLALVSAADSTVLVQSTGSRNATMVPGSWDTAPFVGTECFIEINDQEFRPWGYLMVDEIVEAEPDSPAPVPGRTGSAAILQHRAYPNPANPAVRIEFSLARAGRTSLSILDARGRVVWTGPVRLLPAGANHETWRGRDRQGRPAAAGAYLYRIEVDGIPAATGKIALVR